MLMVKERKAEDKTKATTKQMHKQLNPVPLLSNRHSLNNSKLCSSSLNHLQCQSHPALTKFKLQLLNFNKGSLANKPSLNNRYRLSQIKWVEIQS